MEERRSHMRRCEDVDHLRLEEKIGLVQAEVMGHTHPQIERIITLLEGEQVVHLDGDTEREGGMVRDIAEMKKNGVKWRPSGAFYGAVSAVVVALLGFMTALIGSTHPLP